MEDKMLNRFGFDTIQHHLRWKRIDENYEKQM